MATLSHLRYVDDCYACCEDLDRRCRLYVVKLRDMRAVISASSDCSLKSPISRIFIYRLVPKIGYYQRHIPISII